MSDAIVRNHSRIQNVDYQKDHTKVRNHSRDPADSAAARRVRTTVLALVVSNRSEVLGPKARHVLRSQHLRQQTQGGGNKQSASGNASKGRESKALARNFI